MTLEQAAGLFNYWVVIFLMMTGFYMVLARKNLIKSVIGLNIFQTSVFLLYITMGKIQGGTAPIIPPDLVVKADHHHSEVHEDEAATHIAEAHVGDAHAGEEHTTEAVTEVVEIIYSNPLPSVLMLTAIVVGVATTSLALALVVRIREEYGTIDEFRILEIDREAGS